jgi:hypothetical protein
MRQEAQGLGVMVLAKGLTLRPWHYGVNEKIAASEQENDR